MNINNFNLDNSIISTNSFPNMASRKIHVLLVEHESRDHDNIKNMLHYFSHKVTSVKLASMALSILSKGKVQFDLVMVNMNSPDLLAPQLLHDATKMDLLVIFMSNVDDDLTTLMALEQGAYLCARKPITMAMIGSLWQFLIREKSHRLKEIEQFAKLMGYYHSQQIKEFEKYVVESNQNNINFEEKHKSMKNANSLGALEHDRARYKRKSWMEWTLELHEKFMAAAKQLGQGKCYPKDILEIMDVPGLSRMQVASHLQKCRSAKWLPPNERNSKTAHDSETTTPRKSNKAPRAKTVRFGSMPFAENEESQFNQTMQEYHAMNHQELAMIVDPPAEAYSDGAESSNRRRLELDQGGFYPFDQELEAFSNMNMGLDEQFIYGDLQSFAPLTDILSNSIADNPFELLPIMDSSMVDGFSDFQQEFGMNFNGSWPSFIPDDQVADASDEWFRDAIINPDMEKEETEGCQMREG